jgi:PAT family beta-lactamase induction signal transducer AmpG
MSGRRAELPPPLVGILLLPGGINHGFISVALGFILAQHGVSVSVIAGLIGLRLLPDTWCFLSGPLVDCTLTTARWYVLAVVSQAAGLLSLGFLPFDAGGTALMAPLCVALGIAAIVGNSATTSMVALTTRLEVRGACAGWRQVGYLGGIGLGGGAGLWLSTHGAGPRVAAGLLGLICASCAWPFLLVTVPRAARSNTLARSSREAVDSLWMLLRSRDGLLAVIAVTLPAGLGVAMSLMPAVAGDWGASAALVAMVTGLLGGLANVPGCAVAGYLCDRFPRRTVYMYSALACAAGDAVMAIFPHTPQSFAVFVLANAALTGLAYGSVTAVIFDRLGKLGAATVGGVLSSLSNLPVVLVTVLVGVVQTRHGSNAMLFVEAGLGTISVAVYALLVSVWRPRASPAAPVASLP